jgi:ribosomal protein S18 acetylase RimI-like enzyme
MGVIEPERRVRGYLGRQDLASILAFASRLQVERRPFEMGWHPGDLVWNLQGGYDAPLDNRLWFRGDAIEAYAIRDGAVLWMEALPAAEPLVREMIAWAQAEDAASSAEADVSLLAIRACDGDIGRIAILEALGYSRMDREGVQFRLDLTGALPPPEAIEGFRARDSIGLDPAMRAKAHRDAWDDLAHMGLPQARSAFSTERYLSLSGAPLYDPALDIVVEGPDGALVASCICWIDEASRIGVFEPVGVSPQVRGRRVARLAIQEGLRRMQARGMREAHVGTAHFNASAIGAYLACGFTLTGRSSLWAKAPV